jgi:AraC-like DNA-binding protein
MLYYPQPCASWDDTSKCGQSLSIHFLAQPLLTWLGDSGLEKLLKTAIEENRPLRAMKYLDSATDEALDRVATVIKNDRRPSLSAMICLLKLAWRFVGSPEPTVAPGICDADRRAVTQVCAILERNLGHPTSLKELAGQAGMSASKLKLLFPQACGVTPFAYLRRLRLQKAHALLTSSRMNVTEVALEVGYSSLSHFSRAFAERYGVPPSRMRRKTPPPDGKAISLPGSK